MSYPQAVLAYSLREEVSGWSWRVYDLEGAVVDCALWGDDEELVRSGGGSTGNLTGPVDFSSCFDLDGPA